LDREKVPKKRFTEFNSRGTRLTNQRIRIKEGGEKLTVRMYASGDQIVNGQNHAIFVCSQCASRVDFCKREKKENLKPIPLKRKATVAREGKETEGRLKLYKLLSDIGRTVNGGWTCMRTRGGAGDRRRKGGRSTLHYFEKETGK